jgi:predicted RNA-binding protein YlxR (DUF448 family)
MQQAVLNDDDTDGGKPKAASVRTCIVTRETKLVLELIRFVRSPDGAPTPDLKANLPGRGAWVSARRDAIEQAVRRNSFAQALKTGAKVDPALPDIVGKLLKTRALSALSMASKAGEVVLGALKIEKVMSNKVIALLHAADGAGDGIAKLDRQFRAVCGQEAAVFKFFKGAELDMALGRPNVIHAALMNGGAASGCLQWFFKLAAYENLCEVVS